MVSGTTNPNVQKPGNIARGVYVLLISVAPITAILTFSYIMAIVQNSHPVIGFALIAGSAIALKKYWEFPSYLRVYVQKRWNWEFIATPVPRYIFFGIIYAGVVLTYWAVTPFDNTSAFGEFYPGQRWYPIVVLLVYVPYSYVALTGHMNPEPPIWESVQNNEPKSETSSQPENLGSAVNPEPKPPIQDQTLTTSHIDVNSDPDFIGDQQLRDHVAGLILDDDNEGLAEGKPTRVLIAGPKGVGKRTLFESLSKEYGFTFEVYRPSKFTLTIGLNKNLPSVIGIPELENEPGSEEDLHVDADILEGSLDVPGHSLLVGFYNGEEESVPDSLVPQFDHTIVINRPDNDRRRQLIRYYLNERPHDLSDQDIGFVANWTRGCTGGDIKNILSNATEIALTDDKDQIELYHVERAVVNYEAKAPLRND